MKTMLQSFSVGLLTATLIIAITYAFQDDSNAESLNIDSAKEYLEAEGFHIVGNKEWEELNQNLEEQRTQLENLSKQEKEEEEPKQESQDEPEESETTNDSNQPEEEATTVTIEISSGMTTYDVAELLVNHKIIENHSDFIAYLEDNDYSTLIQIGTFELKAGMSHYEIAEVLTN